MPSAHQTWEGATLDCSTSCLLQDMGCTGAGHHTAMQELEEEEEETEKSSFWLQLQKKEKVYLKRQNCADGKVTFFFDREKESYFHFNLT